MNVIVKINWSIMQIDVYIQITKYNWYLYHWSMHIIYCDIYKIYDKDVTCDEIDQ